MARVTISKAPITYPTMANDAIVDTTASEITAAEVDNAGDATNAPDEEIFDIPTSMVMMVEAIYNRSAWRYAEIERVIDMHYRGL